jgi:hypothetical protein
MFRPYWVVLRQRILLEVTSITLLRIFPRDCYQHVIFLSVFAASLCCWGWATRSNVLICTDDLAAGADFSIVHMELLYAEG